MWRVLGVAIWRFLAIWRPSTVIRETIRETITKAI